MIIYYKPVINNIKMSKLFLPILFLAHCSKCSPEPKDLLCDICVDVVTALDNWLVDDSTQADIVEFVEQVSSRLSNYFISIIL